MTDKVMSDKEKPNNYQGAGMGVGQGTCFRSTTSFVFSNTVSLSYLLLVILMSFVKLLLKGVVC